LRVIDKFVGEKIRDKDVVENKKLKEEGETPEQIEKIVK
jgi:hypothetical protein